MARRLYAGSASDVVVARGDSTVALLDDAGTVTSDTGKVLAVPASPDTLTVWDAVSGGTQVTDLLDVDLNPVAAVTPDARGRFRFYGPDGQAGTLWLDDGATRWAANPAELGSIVADVNTAVSSHSSLDDLDSDDHPQYLNESRHAALDHSSLIAAEIAVQDTAPATDTGLKLWIDANEPTDAGMAWTLDVLPEWDELTWALDSSTVPARANLSIAEVTDAGRRVLRIRHDGWTQQAGDSLTPKVVVSAAVTPPTFENYTLARRTCEFRLDSGYYLDIIGTPTVYHGIYASGGSSFQPGYSSIAPSGNTSGAYEESGPSTYVAADAGYLPAAPDTPEYRLEVVLPAYESNGAVIPPLDLYVPTVTVDLYGPAEQGLGSPYWNDGGTWRPLIAGGGDSVDHEHPEFVPEAPSDGSEYVRKDGGWEVATAASGGTSDHGALSGLGDDDHPQYALANGGRGSFATTAQGTLADSAVQPGDDADTLGSGDAPDGHVLTADGAGNSGWEAPAGGSGAVDSVNGQTGVVVLDPDDLDDTSTAHKFATAAQLSKLDGVEAGATADQTGAQIKAAYEAEADTNAFTDAEKAKLAAVEASADVTDEANVTAALDGATLTAVTGASGDGVLVQDSSAADGLRKVLWENLPGAAGGMSQLADDATPQLGGTLDVNGNAIVDASDGTVQVDDNLDVVGNITVSGTVDGRDVATDGTKLDGVEAGADVTDAANVTAAGALMDSEVTNLAQVKAFDPTDYATAAQGTLADSALQAAHHDSTSTDHDDRYYTKTQVDAQQQAVEGGETRVNTVAASGATETLPAEYAAHKVTMDQACTFTFPTPIEDGAAFGLYLAGAYTPTFPASVVWDGGSAPTYASPSLYVFATFDGGTTWVGSLVGSGLA